MMALLLKIALLVALVAFVVILAVGWDVVRMNRQIRTLKDRDRKRREVR